MPLLTRRSFVLLLALFAGALLPHRAWGWWDDNWTLRKKITIDTTAAGAPLPGPAGTVAMLLRLHDANFQFASAKSDGTDLRFVAEDDKTVLPYHIEKYDALLNEAFVWVKVPDVKPGEAHNLWLYYGNSSAPVAADPKATYEAGTVLVYHFGEHGQAPRDYTQGGNDAGSAAPPSDGALIGGGARFDGKAGITLPASPALAWSEGAAMTWAAWIKVATAQATSVVFSRSDGNRAFTIGLDRGVPYVEVRDTAGRHVSPGGKPVLAGQWHHWAAVSSGSEITLYLDGEAYAKLSIRFPALASAGVLGAEASSEPSQVAATAFRGEIDELEVSRVALPEGAIKFAALTQGGDPASAKLLVLGEDEQKKTWLSWLKSGYFGIILNSLTLDGWVVIGLLFIMAIISWAVMVRKALYLNTTARGNAAFMREWHQLSADLTALESADEEKTKTLGGRVNAKGMSVIRQASVYRIYQIGAYEIRHRLIGQKAGEPKSLSARSIQAIRASLDGGLVRETQRLNSQMVLLTIAISGGPFLGLLGTVVGVMITFAAIAAAGDVNVNAIAPGIAAALVATVAGLAVAIPSLFGYNYLLSRVKDAVSDMQVFIDQFVSKMAEYYSEPKG